MEFVIKLEGVNQLTDAFVQSPDIAAPFLQRALSASSAILAKNTTKDTVPWRTGFLTQTFRAEMSGLVLRWFPTASYAPFVEFGTKPHDIVPKDAKALYWPGARHPVKIVHHPGTQANDFMGRILQASDEEINSTFGQALNLIVAAIAKGNE